jgi:hypothetical protein
MSNGAVETVRIPGREPIVQRAQRLPAPSVQLKNRMEGELRTMLVNRRVLVGDIAAMQRRLDDLNMTINATADMISRIDRDNLTQRLNDEALAAEINGNEG